MVGDFGEMVSSHFVDATIKNFDYNKLDDARGWIVDAVPAEVEN